MGVEMPEYRRLACQLATQLPEGREEARIVMAHLERLIESFLYEPRLSLVASGGGRDPEVNSSLTEPSFSRLADIPR